MNLNTHQKQLTLVGLILLIGAVASQIFPWSGPLVIGVNILLIIEVTRIRYPKNTLSVALIAISVLVLFWGWTSPHIQPFAKPLAIILVFAWFVHCFRDKQFVSYASLLRTIFAIFPLAIFVTVQTEYQLINPLLRGYDNSAHLPALSQVFRHGGFIYSGNLPKDFTFSNYVNGYPPLQQSSWAFVMSLSNIQLLGGYELIRYFCFFFFGTGILAVTLILSKWSSIPVVNNKPLLKTAILTSLFVLLSLSSANFILWQGFPPFLWACCIILATLNLIELQHNSVQQILIGLIGVTLVNYSYPLISPALLLVVLYEVTKLSKADISYIRTYQMRISALVLAGVAVNIPVVIKTLNVKDYLNDDGGIQPVDLLVLTLLFITVSFLLFLYRTRLNRISLHAIAFFSSIFVFAVFAFISKIESGYVSYYPAKAGYLALILGFASLGAIQIQEPTRSGHGFRMTTIRFAAVCTFAVMLVSVGRTLNIKNEPASTHMIITDLIDAQPDPNPTTLCVQEAMKITSDLISYERNVQILYLQDDLLTRWINGVRGRLIDATYSLSISVGQGQQTLPEILDWWTVQYPDVELVILAPTMPDGLEPWIGRIEHRTFNCE